MSERCSVTMKCSAGGVECKTSDRGCQDRARSDGLEVACDRPGEGETVFVYCPPLTQQRDSSAVWILLVIAIAIAVVGSTIAWFALRKR